MLVVHRLVHLSTRHISAIAFPVAPRNRCHYSPRRMDTAYCLFDQMGSGFQPMLLERRTRVLAWFQRVPLRIEQSTTESIASM